MKNAGGYSRVLKYGFRCGDNAPKAIIELVDKDFNAKGQDSGPSSKKLQKKLAKKRRSQKIRQV